MVVWVGCFLVCTAAVDGRTHGVRTRWCCLCEQDDPFFIDANEHDYGRSTPCEPLTGCNSLSRTQACMQAQTHLELEVHPTASSYDDTKPLAQSYNVRV